MAFPADHTLLAVLDVDKIKVSGDNDGMILLVNEESLGALKSTVFANVDNGGGDLRFSNDLVGANQIAIHVLSWDKIPETCGILIPANGVSDTVDKKVYLWGDNTGETQPVASSTYGSESVYTTRKRYYQLDESSGSVAVDSSGNFDGTYNGNLPTVGADFGQDFDGTNDYVSVGSTPLDIDNNFTFSARIKPNGDGQIFTADDSSSPTMRYWQWRVLSGRIRLVVFDVGGSVIVNQSGTAVISNGTDYRVSIAWDGSNYKTYVNGAIDLNVASSTAPRDLNNLSNADIGARLVGATPNEDFNGQVGSLDIIGGDFKTDSHVETEDNNRVDAGSFWIASAPPSGGISIQVPLVLAEAEVFTPALTQPIFVTVPLVLAETEVFEPVLTQPASIELPLVLAEAEIFEPILSYPTSIEFPLVFGETQVFAMYIHIPGEQIQYEGIYYYGE